MAKTDAQRKEKSRKAQAANGRREFPMPPAIDAALQRICDRSRCADWREALSLAVINLDAMDDELFGRCMAIPRHDVKALVDKYVPE